MNTSDKKRVKTENSVLKISMYGSVFFIFAESLMALYTSSQSILMDAVYGGADLLMVIIAIRIVPLLYRPMTEKHPFGFSQVEAIFITIKGAMLTAVTVGLVMNNIQIMLKGGNDIEFGKIVIFEIIAAVISLLILLALVRANKKIESPMVKVEIDAWIIDSVASLGLAIAFLLPQIITASWMQNLVPYLDQIVAILLSAMILPVPAKTVLSGLRDLFLLAPDSETIEEIKETGYRVLKEYGFENAEYDIIKTGRKVWVSIYFKSQEDDVNIRTIKAANQQLVRELGEEYQDLYVELIPEIEHID